MSNLLEASLGFVSAFLPVGTIVSSLLDPEQFGAVGEHRIWNPANGSDIAGSKYSEITGSTIAPDLRGYFLRGLNQMSASEVGANVDQESGRTAGSIQGEQVGPHAHNIQFRAGSFNQGGGGSYASSILQETPNQVQANRVLPSTAGPSETRPVNIAVFYYIKIN